MALAGSFPCVRSLGKIFLYLLLVLIGGTLAAPMAWHLIQMLPPHLFGGLIGKIQGMPFHRYLSRSLQVAAIMLLWPLLRSLRIRSVGELGLHGSCRPLGDLMVGLFSGVSCLLLLESVALYSGVFVLHPGWSAGLMTTLPRFLLTAVVVATVEEFLFRGVLLGFFRQVMVPSMAILLSAIIFSGVHFLNLPAASSGEVAPIWCSGLSVLASLGSSLPPWQLFCWAFTTLFVAGIILAWMTVHTGSLWAAIGLHGSWILGQQVFNALVGFRVQPPNRLLPMFGPPQCHGMVPVGLIPLGALLLAGFLAMILLCHRRQPPLHPLGNR